MFNDNSGSLLYWHVNQSSSKNIRYLMIEIHVVVRTRGNIII